MSPAVRSGEGARAPIPARHRLSLSDPHMFWHRLPAVRTERKTIP
jgi:hypothetical protein